MTDIKNSINRHFKLASGTVCELTNYDADSLEAISALENRANPHPWSQRNFQDSIESSHICVGVTIDETWVAHAVFSIASGDAELLIISVAPEWQGQGIAVSIIEIMSEMLEDYAAELFLEVRASNKRAIKMYDKCGFNRLGVRPSYYPGIKGREDAHIYGKSLRIG